MKLSEFLRENDRRQAFGALTEGDGACAVAQIFEQAFGVQVDRVGVRRESQLLRSVLQAYRLQIPRVGRRAGSATCRSRCRMSSRAT